MSIRTKVLLFAGVALGLVAASGIVLHQSASRAEQLRLQLSALNTQLVLYSELQHQAWLYLGHLLQAGRLGNDTRGLLREHEQLLHENLERLQEGLRAEHQWHDVPVDPHEAQLIDAVIEAQRQWAQGVEVVLRPAAASATPATNGWWELFSTYDQEVSPQLEKARALDEAKQRQLRGLLEETLHHAQQLGLLALLVAAVPLALLAGVLLVPWFRELQELRTGAERLSRGDFSAILPSGGQDELGSLAESVHRLAEQLRTTQRDRQHMLQVEAEAAERERREEAETATRDFLRYNAALEQMVRARTVELEEANTQLASSLRQLQGMQAQLMFADRLASMGRLAAGVGHEINNPLAFVISNLNYVHKELQRTQGAPTEEDKQELLTAVSEAREGAERVRVIVQDLKTLSRPDDAGSGLADLKVVVRAAVKIAAHEIRRRARLVEELDDVPPVLGNASRLGQVFLNLLINAAQAIPEGRVEQNEIRITARLETPTHIVVELRDTGCGIPPEHLERIFDPFFTTKPVGEGTGLGLSLVHSILTALGGSISVQSQVDQGTTFRVSLPAARVLS